MSEDAIPAVDRLRAVLVDISRLTTRNQFLRSLHGYGQRLTPTDGWLLRHLIVEGPARISHLAQWQAVDKSTMTSQVRRLEEIGLVSRNADPNDGRVAIISVTPAGRKAHTDAVEHARRLFSEIISDWPEEEQNTLVTSLERLAGSIEAHLSDSGHESPI